MSLLKKLTAWTILGLTLNNNLSWNQVVTKMSKTAGQQLGPLRRVSSYILHAQRAIIYKAMIWSKMKYASSAWIGATPTSLAQLDSVQNRARGVIGLTNEYEDHRIQQLNHLRAVGAATLFYRMFYNDAPELLCQLMPDSYVHDPRLWQSVRTHDLAVEVPRSNLVSHARSFLPSTAQLWNSFPAQIPALRSRASFSREVNCFLGATSSAASEWYFISAVNAQLCHVLKKKREKKKKKKKCICLPDRHELVQHENGNSPAGSLGGSDWTELRALCCCILYQDWIRSSRDTSQGSIAENKKI